MQSSKILSLGWCKKGTNLYGASNYVDVRTLFAPAHGAKSVRTSTKLQITSNHVSQYRADNANFQNLVSYRHGTVFAPKQYLYQKKALGMQSTKILLLVGGKRVQISTLLEITRIHVSPWVSLLSRRFMSPVT